MTAPPLLQNIQEWFANLITTPLTKEHTLQPTLVEVAKQEILPSHTLEPHQRLEIYNQGYWWRFSDGLIETYPLTARLFGAGEFHERFVMPYLTSSPSRNWDLNELGCDFTDWLQKNYHEKDKELVLNAAHIDWAMHVSFSTKEEPSLDASHLAILDTIQLHLQPHIQLFQLPYDLFSFREEFLLHDVNFGIDHDFPKLDRSQAPYYFILSRGSDLRVEWRPLEEAEFHLWRFIQRRMNLDEIANEFEKIGGMVYERAESTIGIWLHHGVQRKWLTQSI